MPVVVNLRWLAVVSRILATFHILLNVLLHEVPLVAWALYGRITVVESHSADIS